MYTCQDTDAVYDLQPELYKRLQFYSDKIIYCMMDDGEGHAELWYTATYAED